MKWHRTEFVLALCFFRRIARLIVQRISFNATTISASHENGCVMARKTVRQGKTSEIA